MDPKSSNVKKNALLLFKWGVISSIALLISKYIVAQLIIINSFLAILITTLILCIVIHAVKSHEHDAHFKLKWFVFYFLVYAVIIWILEKYLFQKLAFQPNIFSSIIVGFAIAVAIVTIQKIDLRSSTIPWISVVLTLILIVSNLGEIQEIFEIDLPTAHRNSSASTEDYQTCPTPILPSGALQEFEIAFSDDSIASKLNGLIDTSIWRIENNFSSCYKGKYRGQYPDWIYCDILIVSRWGTSSSGTINYRWYTAVTAEWKPQKITSGTVYSLFSFSCENSKKVTVDKGTPEFYVYDSKDGTKISIDASRDAKNINVKY